MVKINEIIDETGVKLDIEQDGTIDSESIEDITRELK